MPELPEVETVVKALNSVLPGRTLRAAEEVGRLRRSFDAKEIVRRLRGKTVQQVRRRGKYIIVDFGVEAALLAHLGMTGSFRLEAAATPRRKHDRAVLSLDGGEELRYADIRRFGFVALAFLSRPERWPEELADLGLEPLERRFSGGALAARAAGLKTPVKVFIMDQRVTVGVGNIYASEALHAAGIDPRRSAGGVGPEEWNRVAAEIKRILRNAIRRGGSSIRNYRTVNGSEGGFQRELRVYGKKGVACPACGEAVETVRLGGRSTFFCPRCQT